MIKVAVFDLDGTLVDSAPDIHAAGNRIVERRGLAPYALAEVVAMIGDGARVLVERALAARGLRVVVAGLDQDYLGKPFEPMPHLLAIAEYITKTRAICMVCGNPANHTQRLVVSSDRVLLGAQGTYEARCRRCFDASLATAPAAESEPAAEPS